MEVKVRKLSDVKTELTISNTAQEVEEAYQIAYKSAQKNLKLPGFRKGKVPREMLEKQVSPLIVEEAAKILLSQNLEKCMGTLEPAPSTFPSMEVKNFDRKKGAFFLGSYELSANVVLGKYKKVELSKDLPKIEPENIQKKLEAMQKFRARLCPREDGVQIGDILEMDMSIQHKNKNLLSYKKKKIFLDEEHVLPGMLKEVLGMKVNEEKSFQLVIPEDFREAEYAGKKLDIAMKLWGCHYKDFDPLDDEFARDCGDFKNLEELKEAIRFKLLEKAQKAIEIDLQYQILAKIISSSEVILSEHIIQDANEEILKSSFEGMIKNRNLKSISIKEISRLINKKPEEMEAALRKRSIAILSEILVVRKIAELEELPVKEEDIAVVLEEQFPHRHDLLKDRGASGAIMDVKSIMKTLEEKDRKEAELVYRKARIRKVLDWLYANARIKSGKEVKLSELIERGVLDESVFHGVL